MEIIDKAAGKRCSVVIAILKMLPNIRFNFFRNENSFFGHVFNLVFIALLEFSCLFKWFIITFVCDLWKKTAKIKS